MSSLRGDFEIVDLEIQEPPNQVGRGGNIDSVAGLLELHSTQAGRARLLAIFPRPLKPTTAEVSIVLIASTMANPLDSFESPSKILLIQGETREAMIADFSRQIRDHFGANSEMRILSGQ